ncbi:hypothetical protein B0H13DRAFT_2143592 [Mycena leptocephala]|nr:hypothetical protein B0H13DRAFT_2143592 [Mycena leptocephala]
MRFSALASLAVLVSAVSATDILVKVGENGTTTYNPSSVTAVVGDNIIFQFEAGNHTVTQSTFKAPCTMMTTPVMGINSDFQFVSPNATQIPQWSFTVNNASSPLWFYCMQKGHCGKGMVFSVNAPATGNTFQAFQDAAKASANATTTGTPPPNGALFMRASTAGVFAVAAGVVAGLVL